MSTLLFFPNEHLLAWVYHARGVPPAAVLMGIARGEWPFPEEWRLALEAQFFVPNELRLCAVVHAENVIVFPENPLRERLPGRKVSLSDEQIRLLRLIAQGMKTAQIARTLKRKRRWVMYQVGEIKRRLGAVTRAEAVDRRGK